MIRLPTGNSFDRNRTILSPSKTQPKGTIDDAMLSLIQSVLRCHVSQRPEWDHPKENDKLWSHVVDPSRTPKLSSKPVDAPPQENLCNLLPMSLSSVNAAPQENLCRLFFGTNVDYLSQVDWKVSSFTGQPASPQDRYTAASEYFSSKQKADDAQAEKQMRWARIQGYATQRQALVKKLFEETNPAQTTVLASQLSTICKAQQHEESAYRLCIESCQYAKNRHSYTKMRYQEICIQPDGYLPDVTRNASSSQMMPCHVETFLPWSSNKEHKKPLRAALEAVWASKSGTCTGPPQASSKAVTLASSTCTPTKSILRSSTYGTPSKGSFRSRVVFTPASEIKTKYFVPPLEAAGIKDPKDRLKAPSSNKCHDKGPITAHTLFDWSQSDSVNKKARFTSFLGSASLEEVARAFHYGDIADEALDCALTLLYTGGFLDNPECPALMIYLDATEIQKRAHLKQLLGLLPIQEDRKKHP